MMRNCKGETVIDSVGVMIAIWASLRLIRTLGFGVGITFAVAAVAQEKNVVVLPPFVQWASENSQLKAQPDGGSMAVPVNYKIGRAITPHTPTRAGELFTFAAEATTAFALEQGYFYRAWMEVEFLKGEKVLQTSSSSELVGVSGEPQLLSLTTRAPEGATAVRGTVCAQNKRWNQVDNLVTVQKPRLLKLSGDEGGELRLEVAEGFPKQTKARTASLLLSGSWPDGTSVTLSTTRGRVAPSVLMSDGRARFSIAYGETEVGSADLTAKVMDQISTIRVADPLAGILSIESVRADGHETSVLIQLKKDGKVLPGRYQESVAGMFISPPWMIDLSPGKWQLRVLRGPEFRADERELDVVSGETLRLPLIDLSRQVDTRTEGWFGGDADGDVYHGERIYQDISARTAAEIAKAMGLAWVGVGSWGTPTPKTWGEAKVAMREMGGDNLLFMWTDEKPKGSDGHACFVGLDRPDSDAFGWEWARIVRTPRNFEMLRMVRGSGGATFANHPLRWWTSGGKFRTNMYCTLPFDLCAAGLLDGYNINEKPGDIQVWSMLLDHGYRVAATAGADFGLDRPNGPVPGQTRLYCYCPGGLTPAALADAVRSQHTIVSTGPVLLADAGGKPPGTMLESGRTHTIKARAWERGDQADDLQRLELWSHGKPVSTHVIDPKTNRARAEHTFTWKPEGEWDWVAVRLISKRGWAMSSAFYAASPEWHAPEPVQCRVSFMFSQGDASQQQNATVEVWEGVPGLGTSRKTAEHPVTSQSVLEVPVSSNLVIRAAGKRKDVSLYDAVGMPEFVKSIAAGSERERPLLDWATYERVMKMCRQATVSVDFGKP